LKRYGVNVEGTLMLQKTCFTGSIYSPDHDFLTGRGEVAAKQPQQSELKIGVFRLPDRARSRLGSCRESFSSWSRGRQEKSQGPEVFEVEKKGEGVPVATELNASRTSNFNARMCRRV